MIQERDALAAHNELLREALQAAIAGLEFRKQHPMRHISDSLYEDRMEDAIEKIKQKLSTTPEACLKEHDARLLEKVANSQYVTNTGYMPASRLRGMAAELREGK